MVEFVAGKITSTIERLIALYRPDSLVVGTRGQTGLVKTWSAAFLTPGMGSVSRWDTRLTLLEPLLTSCG